MNLDKINNSKGKIYLGDIQKDLSSISNLNFNLDKHFKSEQFLGSDNLLREQIASLLILPEVVNNPFKPKDVLSNNFIDEFSNIDIDLQVDNLKDSYFKRDLNFKNMQTGSSESKVLAPSLMKTMLLNLVSSIIPKTLSLLGFPVNNDINRINFSNVSYSDKLSSDSFLNLDASILNGLGNLNTDFALPTIITDENKSKYCDINSKLEGFDKLKVGQKSKKYINLGQINRVGSEINDVTYDDFESKKIKDVLISTGKFDNQVDINDFIRKACGFKSLFPKIDPEGTNEALFDVVKLAGSLMGSSKDLQDNNSVVSLIYDLFKGNDENLSSMMNDLTGLKGNIFNVDNGLGEDVDLNLDLKQRLKHALLSLDNNPKLNYLNNSSSLGDITSSHPITSNLESVSVIKDNDKSVILEELKEFLSWARSVDFEKIIVEPLSTYLINMENIISDLTDTLMYFTQSVSIQSNMKEYKMGSESSRMP